MTFLPIVDRELRVRARQWGTYRLRLAGALVASSVAIFMLVISQLGANPGQMGIFLFKVLAFLAFAFCLFDGARQTADCLSSEKRNGTLGLLFLTDLKGYDVVLGKWIACALPSFYVLLAVLPLLALPLLLGGVTGGEFGRLVLVLLDTLLLSLSLGMLVSALSRDARRAWSGTMALLLILTLLLPMLHWLPLPGINFWSALSPGRAFRMLDQSSYSSHPWWFWQPVLGVHLLGWACVAAASLLLPRNWQDQPAKASRRVTERRAHSASPRAGVKNSERQHSLEVNPVAWLASYSESKNSFLGVFLVLLGGSAIFIWMITGATATVALGILFTVAWLHLFIAISVAYQASYLFADARESGFLDLLLATPLSAREILDGYIQTLKRQYVGPVKVLLGSEILLLVLQMILDFYKGRSDGGSLGVAGLGVMSLLLFVLDLYAVGYFGMWQGLRLKRPAAAFSRSVSFVLLLPLLSLFCCGFLLPVVKAVADVVFLNFARSSLSRQFRTIICERLTQ
jgi:hypothetical protein